MTRANKYPIHVCHLVPRSDEESVAIGSFVFLSRGRVDAATDKSSAKM